MKVDDVDESTWRARGASGSCDGRGRVAPACVPRYGPIGGASERSEPAARIDAAPSRLEGVSVSDPKRNVPSTETAASPVVRHLVFGPDGNRRYAMHAGMPFAKAYELLAHKLVDVVQWSFDDQRVHELTLWVLQEYNLFRSSAEVIMLTRLAVESVRLLWQSPTVGKWHLQLRAKGELDTLEAVAPAAAAEIRELTGDTRRNPGRVVNILVGYNADKELARALHAVTRDHVQANFAELSTRWSIPPVDLFIRTGQPHGFINLSSYWPGLERGRLVSTSLYPQQLTEAAFRAMLDQYGGLVDSFGKLTARQNK